MKQPKYTTKSDQYPVIFFQSVMESIRIDIHVQTNTYIFHMKKQIPSSSVEQISKFHSVSIINNIFSKLHSGLWRLQTLTRRTGGLLNRVSNIEGKMPNFRLSYITYCISRHSYQNWLCYSKNQLRLLEYYFV